MHQPFQRQVDHDIRPGQRPDRPVLTVQRLAAAGRAHHRPRRMHRRRYPDFCPLQPQLPQRQFRQMHVQRTRLAFAEDHDRLPAPDRAQVEDTGKGRNPGAFDPVRQHRDASLWRQTT